MKRQNIRHEVANLVMVGGSSAVNTKIPLPEGTVEGVIVYPDGTHNNNANIITMALRDGNKGFIEEAVHVDNYKHPANGYTGLRHTNFIAGRKVYIEFNSIKAVAADTAFQVVFIVKSPEIE